jgi:hypothetical protein
LDRWSFILAQEDLAVVYENDGWQFIISEDTVEHGVLCDIDLEIFEGWKVSA